MRRSPRRSGATAAKSLLWTADPLFGRTAIAAAPAVCVIPAAVPGQDVVPPEAEQAVGAGLAFEPVHAAVTEQAIGVLRAVHVLEVLQPVASPADGLARAEVDHDAVRGVVVHDHIAACTAVDCVVAGVAAHHVHGAAGADRVVA